MFKLVYYWIIFQGFYCMNQGKQKLGASDIASLVRREISNGRLQLHDRLPSERQLAETYSLARGTIREALTQLSDSGWVKICAGSGTYVTYQKEFSDASPVQTANPLELMDARFALEPHICRLAVLHGRRADFDLLESLCRKMEKSVNDPISFADADTEFHRALANSTHNTLLIWIISQITSVRSHDDWTRMRQITLNQPSIAQYNDQHRQILNALRTREPERAAKIIKDHLETARLSLTRAVET